MPYTALISWKAEIDAGSDAEAVAIAESLMRAIHGPQTADSEEQDACAATYYGEADLDYVENDDAGQIVHGVWHA